jgi:hypothetical protein
LFKVFRPTRHPGPPHAPLLLSSVGLLIFRLFILDHFLVLAATSALLFGPPHVQPLLRPPRAEDAQFRAQLLIANTWVIRVDGNNVGLATTHGVDEKLMEVHTLCIQPDRQNAGIRARVMQGIMTAGKQARPWSCPS